MVRQTSLAAFHKYKEKKLSIKKKVLYLIKNAFYGMTATEVAEELQLNIRSVAPRLTDLYNEGLIKEEGTKWDHHCNQQCIIYKRK